MSCVIPFLPLATLLILAVTTRKMAESMIAAPGASGFAGASHGMQSLHDSTTDKLDGFYNKPD